MDREKLKVIREALNVEKETMESLAKNNAYWAYFGFLDDVLKKMVDALLEEPKPFATDLPNLLEGDRFTAEQIVKLIKMMYRIK